MPIASWQRTSRACCSQRLTSMSSSASSRVGRHRRGRAAGRVVDARRIGRRARRGRARARRGLRRLSITSRSAPRSASIARCRCSACGERGEPVAGRRGFLEALRLGEPVHARFERRAQQRRLVVAGRGARRRRARAYDVLVDWARHGHVATPSCAGTHGGPSLEHAPCGRCACRSAGAAPRLRSPRAHGARPRSSGTARGTTRRRRARRGSRSRRGNRSAVSLRYA